MLATITRDLEHGNADPEIDGEDRAGRAILGEKWVATIPRGLIERHNNHREFGALVVWALASAWRDRKVPGAPPGGWPSLAGTTPRNWHRWRDLAIEHGLVKVEDGVIVPLVERGAGEQWARVPIAAVLADAKLSRTAKRVYVSLALFRSGTGWSAASVGTLAKTAGAHRRNTKRALKELAKLPVPRICAHGVTERGANKYLLIHNLRPNQSDMRAPPKRENRTLERPLTGHESAPFQESRNLESQEGRVAMASDGPTPRDQDDKPQPRYGRADLHFDGIGTAFKRKEAKDRLQDRKGRAIMGAEFYSDWTADRLWAAKRSAEKSLGELAELRTTTTETPEADQHAKVVATLKAQIADFEDHLNRLAGEQRERIAA